MLSSETTLIFISACTSEWRFILILKTPKDLISFKGCISEGLISILSDKFIILDISVGLIDP